MILEAECWVVCDNCGTETEVTFNVQVLGNRIEANRHPNHEPFQNGWVWDESSHHDYCPECVEVRKAREKMPIAADIEE